MVAAPPRCVNFYGALAAELFGCIDGRCTPADEYLVEGAAGCVAGETELFDPIENQSRMIGELARTQTRPWVQTLNGPVLAEVPFLKGFAPLYRVTLATGEAILATRDHVFLARLPRAKRPTWERLDALVPGTELLSARGGDARRSKRRAGGCQSRCLSDCRRCGGQPLSVAKTGRVSSPSRDGVRARIRVGSHSDDEACERTRSRSDQRPARLSKTDSAGRWYSWTTGSSSPAVVLAIQDDESRVVLDMRESCGVSVCRPPPRSRASSRPRSQASRRDRDSVRTLTPCPVSLLSQPCEQYGVGWVLVSSIEYERTDFFYDLCVPDAEHYLANGIYSHNTSKTFTDLHFIKTYCERFNNSRIVLLRNERVAMNETILPAWEDILGTNHFALRKGPSREHRDSYVFRNGSRVILRGFDNEDKLFSGEYHGFLFNEACELRSEDKYETLYRAVRAKKTHPNQFKFRIAEVNPRHVGHWLNQRAMAGRMKRIQTFLHDNPRWFDHDRNDWNEEGREYISALARGLTGVNRMRLLEGRWENNTGAVLPQYDHNVHLIEAKLDLPTRTLHVKGWPQPVQLIWFFAAMDAGFEGAGVLGIWGVDAQDRMFEVCEIYRRHWIHSKWAEEAVKLAREFRLQGLVCDHDKALIAAINQALVNAGYGQIARIANKTLGLPGDKGKIARVEMMRSRLERRELFYVKGCNRFVDEELQAIPNRPWCTPMELPHLKHEEFVYGEDDISKADKIDKRDPDHGFDQTLYAIAFAAGKRVNAPQGDGKCKPGTFGHFLGYDKLIRRSA